MLEYLFRKQKKSFVLRNKCYFHIFLNLQVYYKMTIHNRHKNPKMCFGTPKSKPNTQNPLHKSQRFILLLRVEAPKQPQLIMIQFAKPQIRSFTTLSKHKRHQHSHISFAELRIGYTYMYLFPITMQLLNLEALTHRSTLPLRFVNLTHDGHVKFVLFICLNF